MLMPANAPFQPLTVGSETGAIVAGDFTGEGRVDLAAAKEFGNSVSVLLGDGDGSFQPQVTYTVGSGAVAIVAGDFTGNGHLDLAVANAGDNSVSVLLGNGDGTFQPQVTYAVGSEPDQIVAGDFNGDGRLDLAVANGGSDSVSVLLGNGDGTFQPQVTYAVGASPGAIVAGDFTGDGHLDLAVANVGPLLGFPGTVSVLLGNGDGTFQPQVTYAVGVDPDAIAAGDFTGDGRSDLAVANLWDNTVSVLLGNGDGTFRPQVTYAVGSFPDAIVAGDFTGDGHLDLAVANENLLRTAGTVSVLLGNGDGTFLPQVTYYAGGPRPDAIAAGAFTGDGHLDLAVASENEIFNAGTVSVLLGNGDGTFQPLAQAGNATGLSPISVVAGDFTGNGRTDLAVANGGDNTVSVLLGNSDGTFQPPITTAVGDYPNSIVAGDFNGDGRLDLAVDNEFDDTVSVLLGNGDGTFEPQVTYSGAGGWSIVAGDFTGNGHLDLATAAGSNTLSVLLGNGDGTFQPPVTYTVGQRLSDVLYRGG